MTASLFQFLDSVFSWTYCKPMQMPQDASCCSCRDEGELLTAAWRDSVEQEHDACQPESLPAHSVPVVSMGPGGRTQADASLPQARQIPPTLQVPSEFDLIRLDRPSEAESRIPGSKPEEQTKLLQLCLRSFTRALLRGIRMSVLLDDGRTLLTEASLDSELTHLVLHMPNVQCPVALACIESICSPDEVSAGAVLVANQVHLDERCTTLVLRGGQFLTFVFDGPRAREYFEMCLKVVILAKGGGEPPPEDDLDAEAGMAPKTTAKVNAVSPDAGNMAPLAPRREKLTGPRSSPPASGSITTAMSAGDEVPISTGEQASEAGSETTVKSKASRITLRSKVSFLSKGSGKSSPAIPP
mmetsp:Transcript_150646/g.274164  ORF Transcript_150646/g.274164 Transcript_150646/m.274164 type:complete len:356 (-) Transcript_150646:156-1223(-)